MSAALLKRALSYRPTHTRQTRKQQADSTGHICAKHSIISCKGTDLCDAGQGAQAVGRVLPARKLLRPVGESQQEGHGGLAQLRQGLGSFCRQACCLRLEHGRACGLRHISSELQCIARLKNWTGQYFVWVSRTVLTTWESCTYAHTNGAQERACALPG